MEEFFHAAAVIRRKKNMLLGMEDEDGNWRTGTDHVEHIDWNYFRNMFTANEVYVPEAATSMVDPSEAMSQRLTRVVTRDEVKRAVFEMPADKSSGPDSMTVCFF
ncbi:hypothetical protein LIER_31516 [Lithospermum erythrorhizon]|uniref:Uncharacterized protein n=1 Tax=Lithospermum erythrorhizon TaxID=34254 RepID=A0AAV3RRB0_LITER